MQRQRNTAFQQRNRLPCGKTVIIYRLRIQPGKQAFARWSAYRHGHMGIGEAHALLPKTIHIRCLCLWMPRRMQSPIIEIIADNKQYIRPIPFAVSRFGVCAARRQKRVHRRHCCKAQEITPVLNWLHTVTLSSLFSFFSNVATLQASMSPAPAVPMAGWAISIRRKICKRV